MFHSSLTLLSTGAGVRNHPRYGSEASFNWWELGETTMAFSIWTSRTAKKRLLCRMDDQPKTGILPLGLWDADSHFFDVFFFCQGSKATNKQFVQQYNLRFDQQTFGSQQKNGGFALQWQTLQRSKHLMGLCVVKMTRCML